MGTQTELVITMIEKAPEHKKGRESAEKEKNKTKTHDKHGQRSRQYRRVKFACPEPAETKKRSGPDNRAAKHRKRET